MWSHPFIIQQNEMCSSTIFRPFSHCTDQAGLGAFTAKSGRKHYNPPPLTVMWMNFDAPNFPSFCSLSAIILFQTCSNKCILYVLSFHKCIKIKYKTVNMYGVYFVISAKFVPLKYYTLSSQLRRLTSFSVGCSVQRILSPGQIAVMRKWSIVYFILLYVYYCMGSKLYSSQVLGMIVKICISKSVPRNSDVALMIIQIKQFPSEK